MSVSDWITIISITFAVIAIYPASERIIISFKLRKYEIPLFVFFTLFLLYLIKFDEIANNVTFLKSFYYDFGIKSSDWALLLLLVLIFYCGWQLFYIIPNALPNENLIKFYQKKLKQDFSIFFELFNKYERKSSDIAHFDSYKEIIFNPKFVAETSNLNPYLFTMLLDKMDNNTFKPFFTHVLDDFESVFYTEIKKNNNSFTVESTNKFLYATCHHNPELFIDIGGLKILRDWYIIHLQTERLKGENSIYNQPSESLIDNYEYILPLFYHISFISLLYNEAIINRRDISTLSDKYTNMQTIFSTMIDKMLGNIDSVMYEANLDKDYPTGYHFIISEIFRIIGHWLCSFCDKENYNKESSLIVFIPFCFSLSMKSLFKGLDDHKIGLDFIKRQYHYNLFDTYFSNKLKPEIEEKINKCCIMGIPKEHLQNILEFSLNEKLAINYNTFINNDFTIPVLKDFEKKRLDSLRTYLRKNNLI